MSERPTPETSRKMRDLLKHDIEHRAMVMAAWAMQLERERDEARLALQNALRLFVSNCPTHVDPTVDDLEGCPLCVRAERDEAREALRKAIAQADFWFDDSTAGGKCPDLDDERALLARVDGEKPT